MGASEGDEAIGDVICSALIFAVISGISGDELLALNICCCTEGVCLC